MAQSVDITEIPDFVAVDNVHNPARFRRISGETPGAHGVIGMHDFEIGVVSGRNLSVQPGSAKVFSGYTEAGAYRQYMGSVVNAGFDVLAGEADPRVDAVVLRMWDHQADGLGVYKGRLEILKGSATAAATLANRAGAYNLLNPAAGPKTLLHLADILMPASASTVSAGNIRDMRQWGVIGVPPGLGADSVTMLPAPGLNLTKARINGVDHANKRSYALMWLPRRIVANRIRWQYFNGDASNANPVAAGVNWNVVIASALGRMRVQTGGIAFSGAGGRVDVLSAFSGGGTYDFMPGPYLIGFGVGTVANAAEAHFLSLSTDNTTRGQGPSSPGLFFRSNVGTAAAFPNDMRDDANFVDVFTQAGANLPVPVVSLVGAA